MLEQSHQKSRQRKSIAPTPSSAVDVSVKETRLVACEFQGWMKISKSGGTSWKKLYFALRRPFLAYWNRKEDLLVQNLPEVGSLDISDCVLDAATRENRPFSFELTLSSGKIVWLQASDAASHQKWLRVLSVAHVGKIMAPTTPFGATSGSPSIFRNLAIELDLENDHGNNTIAKALVNKQDNASWQAKIAELESALSVERSMKEEFAAKLQAKEEQFAMQLAVLTNAHELQSSASMAQIESMEEHIQEVSAQVLEAQAQIQTKDAQIEELSVQVVEAQVQIQAKETQVEELSVQVEELSVQVVEAQAHIQAKNAQIQAKETQIEELSVQVVEAQAQIQAKNAQIQAKETQIEELSVQIVEAQAQIQAKDASTRDVIAKVMSESQQLRLQLKSAEQSLVVLNKERLDEVSSLKKEIGLSCVDLAAALKKNVDLEESAAAADLRWERLVADKKKEIAEWSQKMDVLTRELASANALSAAAADDAKAKLESLNAAREADKTLFANAACENEARLTAVCAKLELATKEVGELRDVVATMQEAAKFAAEQAKVSLATVDGSKFSKESFAALLKERDALKKANDAQCAYAANLTIEINQFRRNHSVAELTLERKLQTLQLQFKTAKDDFKKLEQERRDTNLLSAAEGQEQRMLAEQKRVADREQQMQQELDSITKSYFLSFAISVKMHLSARGTFVNVNVHDLWEDAVSQEIAWRDFPDFINAKMASK